MRRALPVLLILSQSLPLAADAGGGTRKKLSAISLLPNGSELKGVMLPRYDENHRLTGVLKSETVTLVNEETVAGNEVSIGFYHPDGSPRGQVNLEKAVIHQTKGILEAVEPVALRSDRLNARGTGLHYAFEQGEGFLTGPVTTWIQAPTEKKTTMNSSPSPRRNSALAGIALISQTLAAAPPSGLTEEGKAELKADAAPAAAIHSQSSSAARADFRADLDASTAATAQARTFLEKAELASTNPSANTPPPAEPKPLDVQPGPKDTVITCDGGMYFDADKGVFVYLRNVRVTDPRFSLNGANELKIFLSKKPDEPEPETKPEPGGEDKPGLGLGAKFGDVERIVATGAVRILQKEVEKGKEPVEASGAIFSYHPETGQILISGGFPWVKQGTTFMRAKEPNLTLQIQKTGSFVTEGNWDMGGTLENKP